MHLTPIAPETPSLLPSIHQRGSAHNAADPRRCTMRLINAHTHKLESFFGRATPPYAILSHVWGTDEISFQQWDSGAYPTTTSGFRKIKLACAQTLADGLDFLWVDTNCIDKHSSAELSEAINSMYLWYAEAAVCYAYLVDVHDEHDGRAFEESAWFTRGWTLQELLAPEDVRFYTADWTLICTKLENYQVISKITRIAEPYLVGKSFSSAPVGERMSWAADRTTTRREDIAYCLLGLFSIHMPILYGERERAFLRLQEEIIKTSTDCE